MFSNLDFVKYFCTFVYLRNRKGLPITFSIVIGEVDGVLLVLANTDFATYTTIFAKKNSHSNDISYKDFQ